MTKSANRWADPPSYAVIAAASQGDPDAINTVIRHYSGYIASHATRFGTHGPYVDDELRKRIETKLIIAILDFDLN